MRQSLPHALDFFERRPLMWQALPPTFDDNEQWPPMRQALPPALDFFERRPLMRQALPPDVDDLERWPPVSDSHRRGRPSRPPSTFLSGGH